MDKPLEVESSAAHSHINLDSDDEVAPSAQDGWERETSFDEHDMESASELTDGNVSSINGKYLGKALINRQTM